MPATTRQFDLVPRIAVAALTLAVSGPNFAPMRPDSVVAAERVIASASELYAEAQALEGVWTPVKRTFGEELKLHVFRFRELGPVFFVAFDYNLPFLGRRGMPLAPLGLKIVDGAKSLTLPKPRKPTDRNAGTDSQALVPCAYELRDDVLMLTGEYDLGLRKLSITGEWRRLPGPHPPRVFDWKHLRPAPTSTRP